MADNIQVKNATGVTETIRTTDTGGVHTPHQNAQLMVGGTAVSTSNPVPAQGTRLNDGTDTAADRTHLTVGGSDGTNLRPISLDTSGRQNVNVNGTVTVSGPLTDTQLRASRVPVNSSVPTASSVTIMTLTTAATGTNWTAFASTACVALDIVNNSGTTIEYRRGGTGSAIPIPSGSARLVVGIANANTIDVRRVDTSNTQVTITAEAIVV